MSKKYYIPSPADTSGTEIPEEIGSLIEEMARNVHEVWAAERMAEGWSPGPERNDARKEHPCLVPYEELPESEKDYDRNTARETLKFILSKGYKIVR